MDKAKQDELYLKTLMWQAPHERPLMIGRTAQWTLEPPQGQGKQPGTWLRLEAGLDLYNGAEVISDQNWLKWSAVPAGWEVQPQPVPPRWRSFARRTWCCSCRPT